MGQKGTFALRHLPQVLAHLPSIWLNLSAGPGGKKKSRTMVPRGLEGSCNIPPLVILRNPGRPSRGPGTHDPWVKGRGAVSTATAGALISSESTEQCTVLFCASLRLPLVDGRGLPDLLDSGVKGLMTDLACIKSLEDCRQACMLVPFGSRLLPFKDMMIHVVGCLSLLPSAYL